MTDPTPVRAPLEYREASVISINFDQRVVEMVAAPYDEEAVVEWRGELWHESFMRGAWDGIEKHAGRIRINRNHDKTKTVGKVINFYPSRDEGLVVEARIAPTDKGEDTLILASEDMLSASAGFSVRGSDQILERPFRRIRRAFMDHIAFVESPAYQSARVLSVRGDEEPVLATALPPIPATPNLDEVVAWLRNRAR